MSTKSDVIVNTRLITPSATFDGIGYPLVIATEKDLAYKEYDISVDISEVLDDFLATDETYLKIQAIALQEQHVKKVAVIGKTYVVTTLTQISAETLTDSGDGLTFNAVNDDFVEETLANLTVDAVPFDIETLASIDWAAGTITFGSSQTGAVVVADYEHYTVNGDINEIVTELQTLVATESTNRWYGILHPFWTKEEVEPLVTFVDGEVANKNRKYISITTPQISLNTDLTSSRADVQTHNTILEKVSDSLMGLGLSFEPGALTYKDKRLNGVDVATYNRTQLNSIDTVGGQTYIRKFDSEVTTEGVTTLNPVAIPSTGRYIDSIQAEDAVVFRTQRRVQESFEKNPKVPNSALGDSIITNAISSVLEPLVETDTVPALIVRNGLSVNGVARTYVIDFSSATYDSNTRIKSGIKVAYKESGAVHATIIDLDVTI